MFCQRVRSGQLPPRLVTSVPAVRRRTDFTTRAQSNDSGHVSASSHATNRMGTPTDCSRRTPLQFGSIVDRYMKDPPATRERPQERPSYEVGGIRIDALTLDQAVAAVLGSAGPRAVHLCNVYTVSLALRDRPYTQCLNRGDLNLPDGMPLVWIARRLGLTHIATRVNGSALMTLCLDRGRDHAVKHYLYGSTPEVLGALRQQIETNAPGALIVGIESPPFQPLTVEELGRAANRMAEAGADVVWVGLGTPKQDISVDHFRQLGDATYVAVGAAFDFLAGTKKQAPRWMQRSGLEWLFRLATEPRRLWKRYLVGNTRFLLRVVARRNWTTIP